MFNAFLHEFFADPFFRISTSGFGPSPTENRIVSTVSDDVRHVEQRHANVQRVASLLDSMVLKTATVVKSSAEVTSSILYSGFPHKRLKPSGRLSDEEHQPHDQNRRLRQQRSLTESGLTANNNQELKQNFQQLVVNRRPAAVAPSAGNNSNQSHRRDEDEAWRKSLRRADGSNQRKTTRFSSSSSSSGSHKEQKVSSASRKGSLLMNDTEEGKPTKQQLCTSFVISPPSRRVTRNNNSNNLNNKRLTAGYNFPSTIATPPRGSLESWESRNRGSNNKMIPPLLLPVGSTPPNRTGTNGMNQRGSNNKDALRRKALMAVGSSSSSGVSSTSAKSGSLAPGAGQPQTTGRRGSLTINNGMNRVVNQQQNANGDGNTDRLNREQLTTKIAAQLACERYLVEMIEREVLQRKPNVEWTSIAGLKEAKSLLQEVVVLPTIVPDFFKGIRRPWKGVLLVGPPGTGKTLLAKAVATECKSTFFNVTSSTLTSKFRGESEKLVRILFQMARCLAPSIIFIDEVDALVSRPNAGSDHEASRRFQAELLIQMDGLLEEAGTEGSILVLAASNHPWRVDEAFRRRFEKRIYIPLPDCAAREDMLRLHLIGMKLDSRLNLQKTAKKLEGYSGADILSVCRDAAMMSLRRKIAGKSTDQIRMLLKKEDLEEPITALDFTEAMKRCKSSVSAQDMSAYEAWMKDFGSY